MWKQEKLTDRERQCIENAIAGIINMPVWENTKGGVARWRNVLDELSAMLKSNTTDGKPWLEPQYEPADASKLQHAAILAIQELQKAATHAFVVGSSGSIDSGDRRYEVVAKFRSIEEMQAFHRALIQCCLLAEGRSSK